MAYTYQTPEIVLRSAEEYLNLDKEAAAFDLLVNYMSGKKSRQWSQAMDKIMTTMIDLAIKFNKKAALREPFANFRFAAQNSNIASFENVVLYFISTTEEEKKGLIALATDKVLDMEDLDNEDPEELFICALDSAPTEKTLIRKALRDVWETYKMSLEIVARNKKLEDLYGQIAKKAFEFCKVYKRKTEFKRLCESMRATLISLIKTMTMNPDYNKIPNAVDLMNPETNEKQILVRFEMLEYADKFSLWQESLKILEDIHNIMMKRRGAIKPKILSDYFESLAKAFWKSEFYLYHAVAYFNHYTLIRTKNKNIKDEDLTQKTCSFVLAVLCIPPIMNENLQSEDARSKAIALLSSEATVPSKQELITYINKHNLLDICTEEVREIYYLIEDSKNMVSLTRNSEPLLKKINEKHQPFHKPLQDIIIYKLLALLSKLYTKLKIENFTRFLGSLDYSFCEKIIHTASNVEHIKVRIDHKRRLLVFQDDVEDMQSLSLKFVNFSEDLKEVIYSIDNKKEEAKEVKVVEGLRENARRFNDSARSALGQRQKLIDNLKRSVLDIRRTEERSVRTDAFEVAKVQRDQREQREEEKRETKHSNKISKRLEDLQQLNKENLVKRLLKIKGFKVGNKKLEDMKEDEIAQLSVKKLEEAQDAWVTKEKGKEEAAVRNAFKRADFWERAKREEYINIMKSQWASAEAEKEEIMKIHKENFNQTLEFKAKIFQAAEFREVHIRNIERERKEAYDEQLDEFKEKIIENFKDKILEMAKESLEEQKKAQAEEEKKREEENQKQRKRLEEERAAQAAIQQEKGGFTGFQRSTLTREEIQKKAEETKKEDKPFSRAPASDNKAAPTGIIQRGSARKEEEKPAPFRRNEGESGEAQKPRFLNAKKEGEEKKNPFGDARPVAQPTQTTQPPVQTTQATTAPADDGWRTTSTATKKKEDAPKSFGFTRGPTSGAPSSGGPPKFTRGGDSSNTTSGNTSTGGGWRK